MIEVYILDDHPAIASGVRQILHETTDIRVTGVYHTGAELLEALRHDLPDVLLLDIHLPDVTGNSLARIISGQYPGVAILAFTNMQTAFHMKDMMMNGCSGYLPKTAGSAAIVEGIREVYEGRTFVGHALKQQLGADLTQEKKRAMSLPPLTRREQEVLQLICSGQSNQQIADRLYISLRTVEGHRLNLLHKLNAGNVAEMVKMALHAGLVD